MNDESTPPALSLLAPRSRGSMVSTTTSESVVCVVVGRSRTTYVLKSLIN